jgi:hypothetical protein
MEKMIIAVTFLVSDEQREKLFRTLNDVLYNLNNAEVKYEGMIEL